MLEKNTDSEIPSEAISRKERSEAILVKAGVPINPNLPVVEDEANATQRTTEEVAYRALALLAVAVRGSGCDHDTLVDFVNECELDQHFSPNECAYILDLSPSQHEHNQFSWRFEAAWVLLWALGYVDVLEPPSENCSVERVLQFIRVRNVDQFIADARLRSMREVLDETDLSYRHQWAVVDARLNGKETPTGVEPGVTYERLYAFNWLVGYLEQEWDEISTDT